MVWAPAAPADPGAGRGNAGGCFQRDVHALQGSGQFVAGIRHQVRGRIDADRSDRLPRIGQGFVLQVFAKDEQRAAFRGRQ